MTTPLTVIPSVARNLVIVERVRFPTFVRNDIPLTEFTLSKTRKAFPFTSFGGRMTGSEGFGMTFFVLLRHYQQVQYLRIPLLNAVFS